MKYSEFETIAKENGWKFDIDEFNRWVRVNKDGFEIVISKFEQNYFDLCTIKGSVIDLHREKEFIEACYELSETPLEDREDEKYYTVELPFLNVEDKKIILNGFHDEPYWSTTFASRFTEKEIKEIDPRLWQFAVEVKNQRIEQIEKELQELKEQVVNQKQAKNKTPIGWMPETGGVYHYVNCDGSINSKTNSSTFDDCVIKHYKVFQTEEEAEFHAEKMKVIRELEKFAREFVYCEENWAIAWDYPEVEICYTFTIFMDIYLIYFESKEKATEAIQAVREDRIKKYYLEVEDD